MAFLNIFCNYNIIFVAFPLLVKFRTTSLIIFILIAFNTSCKAIVNFKAAQRDSLNRPDIKRQRINGLTTGFLTGYSGSFILLHRAWYSKETKVPFHFYNDSDHWNQMDKFGHFWSSFHQSRIGAGALKWAGLEEKQSLWIGGLFGIIAQAPIEIFDGYSSEYGASVSDIGANFLGSALFIAQYQLWNEIRMMPKFSFHTTTYASQRPNTLGQGFHEQILKDYNGQTYWLSFDISSFFPSYSKYPKWLNLATGYGSSEMMYGNPESNTLNGYSSYRKFYLSPDINLQHIKTRNKILKTTFYLLNIIKIPMPAIEFNSRKQIKFHPIYF